MKHSFATRQQSAALFLLYVVFSLLILVFLLHLFESFAPEYSNTTIVRDGFREASSMPVWSESVSTRPVIIETSIELPSAFSPKRFNFFVRGSLRKVVVNGTEILGSRNSLSFDLSNLLRPGNNSISVVVVPAVTPLVFGIDASFFTFYRSGFFVSLFLFFLLCAYGIFRFFTRGLRYKSTAAIFVFGTFLATLTCAMTPYYVRSYDWWGHFTYIEHLRSSLSIPEVGTSWQAHQPPLSYILYACTGVFGSFFGLQDQSFVVLMQSVSLAMVLAMIAIALRFLESRLLETRLRIIVSLFFVTLLPIVTLSSQVSNDVLVTLLGIVWFISIAGLTSAETINCRKKAFFIGLLVGLALLTKFSAIPLLFLSVLLPFILCTRRQDALRVVVVVLFTTIVIVSPYWSWRSFTGQGIDPVANAEIQEGTLPLTQSASEFVTFNPLAIVQKPYAEVASDVRSTFFLESLIRRTVAMSSSSGLESSYLAFFALLLLPLIARGAYKFIRSGRDPQTLLALLFALLSLVVLRYLYPYTSTQHVRYIVYAFLPLTILLAEGLSGIRTLLLRALAEMSVATFALVSAVSILSLMLV